MRVVRSNGPSARALLIAAVALVSLSAPPVGAADDTSCVPMNPKMQAGFRALENRQYGDARKAFELSGSDYAVCGYLDVTDPKGKTFTQAYWTYWGAYGEAGQAAAAFGEGNTADGLKFAKHSEFYFSGVMNGQGPGEGASADLRRAASDGLAYVRSLESSKKPLLPKIWLDWKAAHH